MKSVIQENAGKEDMTSGIKDVRKKDIMKDGQTLMVKAIT